MIGCSTSAIRDEEIVRARMLRRPGSGVVEHYAGIAPPDLRTGTFCPVDITGCEPSPAADADHLVELRPAGKRVIRRMEHDQPTAALDVIHQRLLERRRELEAFVVQHHGLIVGELRCKARHVLIRRRAFRRRRLHAHGKAPALLQLPFDDRAADFPVVIPVALAGDEKHLDGRLGRREPVRSERQSRHGHEQSRGTSQRVHDTRHRPPDRSSSRDPGSAPPARIARTTRASQLIIRQWRDDESGSR